jgi:gamma-glutamyltranspeptidase/glutathione hydrolase
MKHRVTVHLRYRLFVWVMGGLGMAPACLAAPPSSLAATQTPDASHYVEATHGIVVTVSAAASEVGIGILKRGGNAVDAAVATAFALEVSYPLAGNLGGGGFMLIHPGSGRGEPVCVDYRETAPAAARPEMFNSHQSQLTHLAVATPGTVRGMALAHQRFGKLEWRELIEPAITLARSGFLLDRNLADSLNATLATSHDLSEFERVFSKPGGGWWLAGDRLIQPDVAQTLQLIADGGADAFYTGPIARDLAAEMAANHGLISLDDLAGYRAIERKPLTMRYRGKYDVYAPPPPSSGGTCLLEELQILQNFDLRRLGRWSPQTIHLMAEAMRRASYDRARYLGDPAFVAIPQNLITPEYGRDLAKTIDPAHATSSRTLAADLPLAQEGQSTTHFSIIDEHGMAVANTYTLERRWGSRIVVKNRGFILNNDMFAFNLDPGLTDTRGNIGTAPNLLAPGKRPLSSQTPTIVAEDGKVKLITGSPGSRAIPHTVLGIIVSTLDFDLPIRAAVDAPRMSHQWFPDQITFETPERYGPLIQTLTQMGHEVVRTGPLPQGDAHTIWVGGVNDYVGVADHRIHGAAAGY